MINACLLASLPLKVAIYPYLYHSIFLLAMENALTFFFYPLRFTARALTVFPDYHPYTRLSSSTSLLQVAFGRPGLLLTSGLYSNAMLLSGTLHYTDVFLDL